MRFKLKHVQTDLKSSTGFLTAFRLEESGQSPLNGQGLKQAGYIQRVAAL